jgi:MGT family glycosyltransferase
LRDRALRPLVFGTVSRVVVRRLNEVRAGLGLGPVDAATMFAKPPLLLYMTAEPFEYPRSDWPPSVKLVGPCAWDPPAPAPAWLEEVERPLVLVTTSSEFQDDGRLVETALAALAEEELEVVATVPTARIDGLAVPANARVLPFVPHAALLERAACAITHGGMGATQKAIARGVPVCAVPFGRDQLEVARRVEVSGAGTRLPARRLSPDALRAKVHGAIARREGAERIAAAFAATGGPAAAADAVAALTRR